MNKFLCLIITTFFLLLVFPVLSFGNEFSEQARLEESEYQKCLETLPTSVKVGLMTDSMRGKRNWKKGIKRKVDECLNHKRLKEDYEAIITLSNDLKGLHQKKENGIIREADEISQIFITVTREGNKRFRMGKSALWHNFLIKLGAREGGYCYQWTAELLDALPLKKYDNFERHWGVYSKGNYLENNAIIITKRGDDLSKGIVYDAWRGKGRPFWRFVSKDTQTWRERISEDEILSGQTTE